MKRDFLRPGCFLALLTLMAGPALAVPHELAVTGLVKHELHLSYADLQKLRPVTLLVRDRDQQEHEYVGVPVQTLLKLAGVVAGEQLQGIHLRDYLLATAQDGSQVIFSLAELDLQLAHTQAVVVFKEDDKPLPAGQGPLRLVVPGDMRLVRWIGSLKSLTVLAIPGAPK